MPAKSPPSGFEAALSAALAKIVREPAGFEQGFALPGANGLLVVVSSTHPGKGVSVRGRVLSRSEVLFEHNAELPADVGEPRLRKEFEDAARALLDFTAR